MVEIIFFNASWNDFLWPLIVLNDRTKYTVNLALPTLRGVVDACRPYADATLCHGLCGLVEVALVAGALWWRYAEAD